MADSDSDFPLNFWNEEDVGDVSSRSHSRPTAGAGSGGGFDYGFDDDETEPTTSAAPPPSSAAAAKEDDEADSQLKALAGRVAASMLQTSSMADLETRTQLASSFIREAIAEMRAGVYAVAHRPGAGLSIGQLRLSSYGDAVQFTSIPDDSDSDSDDITSGPERTVVDLSQLELIVVEPRLETGSDVEGYGFTLMWRSLAGDVDSLRLSVPSNQLQLTFTLGLVSVARLLEGGSTGVSGGVIWLAGRTLLAENVLVNGMTVHQGVLETSLRLMRALEEQGMSAEQGIARVMVSEFPLIPKAPQRSPTPEAEEL